MPLFGTLQTMPLPDLLQWIGAARLSGTLQIEREKVGKSILFQDGQVVGCSSEDPPERLGQFLISRGKITEEQLRQALALQERHRRHLGMTLVEMGALPAEELSSHLELKAEETIFSLFDWPDAVFRFQQGAFDEANVFPIRLRVEDVLLRGLKRYDELKRIREVFHDTGIVLRPTTRPLPDELVRRSMARTLIEAVDGRRTIADILLHVHGSEYAVTKFLFELYRGGFLEIAGIREVPRAPLSERAPEPPPDPGPEAAAPAASPSGATGDVETILDELLDSEAQAIDRPPEPESEPKELESVDRSDAKSLERHLDRARECMRNGEFEPALDILDRLYADWPGDESLRRLTLEAEAAFVDRAYRYFLPAGKVPRLTRPVDQLLQEHMSPTEFFLLSRIDGTWNVKSIIQVAPLREVETLRALKRLREHGLVELVDADPD